MDRTEIKKIRNELGTILNVYGERKGLQFEIGSISYSNTGFTVKLSATCGETKEDADRVNWNKNCWRVNLKQEDFGKEIAYQGNSYMLIGIKPKSRKYPIVVRKMGTDAEYKLTTSCVRTAMESKY